MATGSTSYVNFEKLDFDRIATTSNYIDRGAFGEVYGPFTWNSRKCAFKRIWISKGRPGDDFKIKVEEKRHIWITVKHKNLIEIHNVVFGPKAIYIVMEFASGGSLRNLLDNYDTYRLIDVSNWARQIAGGMLNLHEKDIVHRDLKSSNVVLMAPFDSVCPHKKMTLKITDFDDVREHTHTTTMSFRGTVAYTAPEVLNTDRFSKASDVWSFGVVMWEMLTGGRPHEDLLEGAIMMKAQSGQLTFSVPDSVPRAYKELLCDCLHQDQSRRPSFHQIIDLLYSSYNKEGDEELKLKILRRGVSFRDGTSNTGQKSSTFRPSSSRLSLGQVQPDGTQQKSATLRPLSRTPSTPKSATLRSSGRRAPLESTQCDLTDCKADSYLIKEIKTRASEDNCKAIHGLAILDNELFIISRVSSDIEVHDAYRLVLVKCVELKTLEAPWDIVSCNINKCLYIMNWKKVQSKAIVRIDPNGNVIKQWSTGSNCGRLSITQDSNIILAAYKSDKIIEYTSEGGLVREIKLSYQLAHPQHAIKLDSSRFLIIHGMYDDFQQRLCLLDSTGCVLASFGGEKGSGKTHLHGPIYMAVDRAGSIFIAEYGNSRVLLLSQSLQFKQVLLSEEMHGLRDPWSIHLDEANGRLFVVDNDYEESKNLLNDGRILVFYIKSLYLLLANETDIGVNSAGVLTVQSYF